MVYKTNTGYKMDTLLIWALLIGFVGAFLAAGIIANQRNRVLTENAALKKQIVKLRGDIDFANKQLEGMDVEVGEWQKAAEPAFARLAPDNIFGKTPMGLVNALNPCMGPHGEWLAECMVKKDSKGALIPMKIIRARH